MAGLRNAIQEQKVEFESLKSSIIKVEKENNALETELNAARRRLDEQEEEIVEFNLLQDNLEQYTRKPSLEICGIPDRSAYSSTEDAVLQLGETLDVPLSPGARFSKAPETFRARKAIFSSSVSKNG